MGTEYVFTRPVLDLQLASHHTMDMSTNWRQSFLCCHTTCMEQAADRPEAAVVDRLISQETENILFEFMFGH